MLVRGDREASFGYHEDVGERTRFPFDFMTLDTQLNVSDPFLKGDDNNIYQGCCKVQNLNTSCMFAVVLTHHRCLIIAHVKSCITAQCTGLN